MKKIISCAKRYPEYIGIKKNGDLKWLISTKTVGDRPIREWQPYGTIKKLIWKLYVLSIPVQRCLANFGFIKGYNLEFDSIEPSVGLNIACVYVNLVTSRPKLVVFFKGDSDCYFVKKYPVDNYAKCSLENERSLMNSLYPNEVVKEKGESCYSYHYISGTPFGSALNIDCVRFLASLSNRKLSSLKSFKLLLLDRMSDLNKSSIHFNEIEKLKDKYRKEVDVLVPGAVVHGDFAPWNVKVRDDLIIPFDWEECVFEGVVAWDVLSFELSVHARITRDKQKRIEIGHSPMAKKYVNAVRLDEPSFMAIYNAFLEIKYLESKVSSDKEVIAFLSDNISKLES